MVVFKLMHLTLINNFKMDPKTVLTIKISDLAMIQFYDLKIIKALILLNHICFQMDL